MNIVVLPAASLSILGLLLMPGLACAQQAAAPPPKAMVVSASLQPVFAEQSTPGRIQSTNIVALNARVTGYLEQQLFKDGDNVVQGQLLYVIEQAPYQAAVAQAQANLEQAMAQSHNADLTFARQAALLDSPAGNRSTVDSAKASALSGSAQIDGAKAALQEAQINLGYTEIRAPISGQISATTVNPGNVVGPTSGTLATIVSQDPIYVTFSLPTADALKVLHAAANGGIDSVDMLLQLPDGSQFGQSGRIDFINNQVNPDTDTLNWRGTIPNPALPGITTAGAARALINGEYVSVILRNRTPQNQITLPRAAVITDQLGDYVLKLGPGNKALRQAVRLGTQTNDSVEISQGLAAGDKVIVGGLATIQAGSTVTPVAAAAQN